MVATPHANQYYLAVIGYLNFQCDMPHVFKMYICGEHKWHQLIIKL